MVQGSRRAPGGKSLPGVKLNRKSVVSKRKVMLANVSKTGSKSSRKSNSGTKIQKILTLPQKKANKINKKTNSTIRKKINLNNNNAFDAPGPSTRADANQGRSQPSQTEDFHADS
uniref:Uncharacterized protein n=1 Tax=Strigamia maritima TaxID=126957 RepID=T1IHR5_STRMM